MERIKVAVIGLVDILLAPATLSAAWLLRVVRRWGQKRGMGKMKVSRRIFSLVGLYPLLAHYYEPLQDGRESQKMKYRRALAGIDYNVQKQLNILKEFNFNDELEKMPFEKSADREFYYHHSSFGPGDAEYLYNMVRRFKPQTIIEVGCGNSTLMMVSAVNKNKTEDPGYSCRHICIEPYKGSWLDKIGVEVIRKPVEALELETFAILGKNDILFIDSSHVVRSNGDVVFQYNEVLPILRSGVFVHSHDIFTPDDYPEAWMSQEMRFWSEQY
jgi:hypothetical protein